MHNKDTRATHVTSEACTWKRRKLSTYFNTRDIRGLYMEQKEIFNLLQPLNVNNRLGSDRSTLKIKLKDASEKISP